MTHRDLRAGVTLIEMLVALSVFSMIGLASFTVLDTILRTDRQTGGRLEEYTDLDRAFRIFEADVLRAQPGLSLGEGWVKLTTAESQVIYQSQQEGLVRRIERPGMPAVAQQILPLPASASWRTLSDDSAAAIAPGVEMTLYPDGARSAAVRKLVPLAQNLSLPE